MGPDAAKAQLDRVLSSPQFVKASRLGRFLRLIVEESLRGNDALLKEHRIGVEVYDRGRDFDPRLDPIVRVQAAKLRSKLLEYYAGAGADDPIVIEVPKGSYVPAIRERGAAAAGTANRSRVAVLPFVNIGDDPGNEPFIDGLTEELISRLARIPGLQVVARTSVFRFKGRSDDVREIGRLLAADVVLEGSARWSKERVRVTAQLIAVDTGYHLFSRTYQREWKDLFELQDELARAVVQEVAPGAVAQTRTPSSATPVDVGAYQAYLRGMFVLANRHGDVASCLELFRDALAIDPRYAPAWAGLSQAYWVMAWFHVMPAEAALRLSRDAALRTLEIDPDSAQAHAALGVIEAGLEWRWAAARSRFDRAIELEPGLAFIYPFYAVICLLPQGRVDDACATIRRGLDLDPFNPLFHAMATYVFAAARRNDDALRQADVGFAVHPGFPPGHVSRGLAHETAGRLDDAITCYRRGVALAGDVPVPLSFLGHALAVSGQTDEARQILERLLASTQPLDLDVARIYLGLGDTDAALRWLDVAIERRNIHLVTVPTDVRFDPLRSHPRFQDLLHRMNLQ